MRVGINRIRWQSPWMAFAHDFLSIPLAWFGAFWLRLGDVPPEFLKNALLFLPCLLCIQALACWQFGLYRGLWRFASLPDLARIIKAVFSGSIVLLAILFIVKCDNMPRSIIPLYSMLLLMMLGGSRFFYRWLKDKKGLFKAQGQRVLIVGAGAAGDSLARDLLRDIGDNERYHPVVFVDDSRQKMGRELRGLRIVGSTDTIPKQVRKYRIDLIMIAIPSANAADMRRIHTVCEQTGVPVRTLPAVNDLISGRVSIRHLRKIALEDLLGRDPVKLDWKSIKSVLEGKTVLISGGGGSIGSELCRQVLRHSPKKIIIVDNSEYNLFVLEQGLLHEHKVDYELMDINDLPALNQLLIQYSPDIIFHAAAYKQVPLLEPHFRAAVKNNILGTYGLAQAAVENGVKQFVLVSTDKAVNPTNIMGATKCVAEKICHYFNQEKKTRFISVRFGNVLGSRGSVVETFQKQLETGGPLTVTHPDITRFFMTIQEASQLILQALSMGQGQNENGELFVLDMGEPVNIRFMAEQMIHLAGKKIDQDVSIEYIGLRAGEKLHEELFYQKEKLTLTSHPKIFKAQYRELDYQAFLNHIIQLERAVYEMDLDLLRILISKLVPEYHRFCERSEALPPPQCVFGNR